VELGVAAGVTFAPPDVPATVFGSPADDSLLASYGTAELTMYGMGGDDTMGGGGGRGHLDGGAGNDTLYTARSSEMTLVGGPGNDTFHSSEGVPGRFVCGTGKDDLFIDWRPGLFSVDTASCPPFLLDRHDMPTLRVKGDRTVGVPVTFSEPAKGWIHISRGARPNGSARVKRYRRKATLRLRLDAATYRQVRSRGRRGLQMLVTATPLVDRSRERTHFRHGSSRQIGGYVALLRR
jgi:hypothetical protein